MKIVFTDRAERIHFKQELQIIKKLAAKNKSLLPYLFDLAEQMQHKPGTPPIVPVPNGRCIITTTSPK
jgi:hypothetical protein